MSTETITYGNVGINCCPDLEKGSLDNVICIRFKNTSQRVGDFWDKVQVFLEYTNPKGQPQPIRSVTVRDVHVNIGKSLVVPMELHQEDWQDPHNPTEKVELRIFLYGIQKSNIIFESVYKVSSLVERGAAIPHFL